MTYHTIDFDLTDLPIEKRVRPMMMAIASTTPPIESFGWGDFPIMTLEELHHTPFEKTNVVDASDVTADTAELEYEDDSLPDSELAEEEETNLLATSGALVKPLRQVSFGEVEVREYIVVLGVHPLASGGYPMELGWDYNVHSAESLNSREQQRSREGLKRLSYIERHFRLAEMCGGNLCQIMQEEKRRKAAHLREKQAAPLAEEESACEDHISDYTKQQMVRNASYASLSRSV